jgi:hypothetical protein
VAVTTFETPSLHSQRESRSDRHTKRLVHEAGRRFPPVRS